MIFCVIKNVIVFVYLKLMKDWKSLKNVGKNKVINWEILRIFLRWEWDEISVLVFVDLIFKIWWLKFEKVEFIVFSEVLCKFVCFVVFVILFVIR